MVTLKEIRYDRTSVHQIRMEECMQHRVQMPAVRRHLCTFLVPGGVTLVLEHVEGTTMSDYAKANHPIPKELLAKWAAQLSVTLMALHQHSVVFMDLTSKNILVSNQDIKLIDFGLATDASRSFTGIPSRSFVGTAYYAAPEIAKDILESQFNTSFVRPSVDWYALGVVLYRAATRKHLYGIKEIKHLYTQNRSLAKRTLFQRIQLGVEIAEEDRNGREDLMDYIQSITAIDPAQRLGTTTESYHTILGNPIFKEHPNLKRLVGIPSL